MNACCPVSGVFALFLLWYFSIRFRSAKGEQCCNFFLVVTLAGFESNGKVYLALVNLLLGLETSTTKDYWI